MENIEKKLQNIWETYQNVDIELINRKYAYCIDTIEKKTVLFIGLNPSFNKNAKKEISLYSNKNSVKLHPYFKKIASLELENSAHLDLLYFRETKAKKIHELLKTELGIHFIWEQLQLTKGIIEELKPNILVVANTTARLFLGKEKNEIKNEKIWLNYDFKFDEEIGTDRIITDGKLKNTPVFFTSMLSGQRAMDNGSFERLKWHINFVLEKINKNN